MIHYITGDATAVQSGVIAHIVNDQGLWGLGFTAALDARVGHGPRAAYLRWHDKKLVSDPPFVVGYNQVCHVGDGLVVNMLAQLGVGTRQCRVHYTALGGCLVRLGVFREVHMPKIGTGLGGGNWALIAEIIRHALPQTEVYVYTLPTADTQGAG